MKQSGILSLLILLIFSSCTNSLTFEDARDLMINGKYEDAIDVLDKLIENHPDFDSAYIERGYAYIAIGQHKKALDDFNKVLRNPEFKIPALEARAYLFYDLGDSESAIIEYSQIIKIEPDNYSAFFKRGAIKESSFVYGRTEDSLNILFSSESGTEKHINYSGALKDYDEAIRINPSFADAYIARGRIYSQLHFNESALAEYKKASELDPDNYLLYLNRGILYRSMDEYNLALDDFNKAININPNDPVNYVNRGYLKGEDMKDKSGACVDFQKAAELGLTEPYLQGCK